MNRVAMVFVGVAVDKVVTVKAATVKFIAADKAAMGKATGSTATVIKTDTTRKAVWGVLLSPPVLRHKDSPYFQQMVQNLVPHQQAQAERPSKNAPSRRAHKVPSVAMAKAAAQKATDVPRKKVGRKQDLKKSIVYRKEELWNCTI
jgi:hypothetical protein